MADEVRDDLKYSDSHEWVKVNGDIATVGITDHAQKELTDIVFVEFPEVGKQMNRGDELCVVESVKSVSETYAPVTGEIVEVNEALEDSPESINSSPYDDGWLVKIKMADASEVDEMMDAAAYKEKF